jgi:hypothetical protein
MFEQIFEDLKEGGPDFRAWHCILCGEILDEVIRANRALPPSSPLRSPNKRHNFPMPIR